MDADARRGVLFPARLPTFTRIAAPASVSALVRHFWIPEWDIGPGRISRQDLLGYPALNLAVEPDLVGLAGATTVRSHRDLTGSGWTVGAMLWPAAVPALCAGLRVDRRVDPAELVDAYVEVDAPDLHATVASAMTSVAGAAERHERAVSAFSAWLRDRCGEPGAQALLANEAVRLAETDRDVRSTADLAERLGVSGRTLQRVVRAHLGLSPLAVIRRRRLQESAERLREVGPEREEETIAEIAADLGYADQAHLARDFRSVLGWTPRGYRDEARSSVPR